MRSAAMILAFVAAATAVPVIPGGLLGPAGVIRAGGLIGPGGIPIGPGALSVVPGALSAADIIANANLVALGQLGALGLSVVDDGRNIGRGNRAADLAALAAAQAAQAVGNARVTAEQVAARAAANAQYIANQASNAANNAANRATSPLYNADALNLAGVVAGLGVRGVVGVHG